MATIRDIAKLAGVSATTVSRVLNLDDKIKVTLETRKRIFDAAEQLSYQKAEQLIHQYALVHWYDEQGELNDPFFLSIRLGIEKEFKSRNIVLEKYFNSAAAHTFEKMEKKYQGIIALGRFSPQYLERLSEQAKNLILVHDISESFQFDSIIVDFKQITRDVINKIISQGHRKIGFIGGRELILGSGRILEDERESTFYEYLTQMGIYNSKYVRIGAFNYDDGYSMMKSLLQDRDDLPTCCFVASDTLAIGAMRALQEAGVKIPSEMAIIGCNDIPAAKYTTPSLSTVRIHTDFMGCVSARVILEAGDRKEKMRVVIPHEIILRDTFCEC